MRAAVVLAGGPSRRMGRPKALLTVGGEPLVRRVVTAALAVTDDVIVASRGALVERIQQVLPPGVRVVRDRRRVQAPLAGLEAGACASRAAYVAVLACDLPFVSAAVIRRLFVRARGADAAVPRWPNGDLEPLAAVYRRSALLGAVLASLAAGERSNVEMIRRLRRVRFVPTSELRAVDPGLQSFRNLNTAADLTALRRLTRSGASPRRR